MSMYTPESLRASSSRHPLPNSPRYTTTITKGEDVFGDVTVPTMIRSSPTVTPGRDSPGYGGKSGRRSNAVYGDR